MSAGRKVAAMETSKAALLEYRMVGVMVVEKAAMKVGTMVVTMVDMLAGL